MRVEDALEADPTLVVNIATFAMERACLEERISLREAKMLRGCARMDFSTYVRGVAETMILRLERDIPTMYLQKIEFPRTWWDALKQRWFPGWAKKRWPVEMTVYDAKAYFPEMHKFMHIDTHTGKAQIAYITKKD